MKKISFIAILFSVFCINFVHAEDAPNPWAIIVYGPTNQKVDRVIEAINNWAPDAEVDKKVAALYPALTIKFGLVIGLNDVLSIRTFKVSDFGEPLPDEARALASVWQSKQTTMQQMPRQPGFPLGAPVYILEREPFQHLKKVVCGLTSCEFVTSTHFEELSPSIILLGDNPDIFVIPDNH